MRNGVKDTERLKTIGTGAVKAHLEVFTSVLGYQLAINCWKGDGGLVPSAAPNAIF